MIWMFIYLHWSLDVVLVDIYLLGASFAFKTMKGKTGRITMLMTPVTAFEKFFFRWLIYVLVLPLLILLSIWLADYTRVLFILQYTLKCLYRSYRLQTFCWSGDGGYSLCHSWVDGSLLILLNVYIQSFFLLGSIIWPKNSFKKRLLLLCFLFSCIIG